MSVLNIKLCLKNPPQTIPVKQTVISGVFLRNSSIHRNVLGTAPSPWQLLPEIWALTVSEQSNDLHSWPQPGVGNLIYRNSYFNTEHYVGSYAFDKWQLVGDAGG